MSCLQASHPLLLRAVQGHPTHAALLSAINVTFVGFSGGDYQALEACGKCKHLQGGFHTFFSGIRFLQVGLCSAKHCCRDIVCLLLLPAAASCQQLRLRTEHQHLVCAGGAARAGQLVLCSPGHLQGHRRQPAGPPAGRPAQRHAARRQRAAAPTGVHTYPRCACHIAQSTCSMLSITLKHRLPALAVPQATALCASPTLRSAA